jgi:hypothetical protein
MEFILIFVLLILALFLYIHYENLNLEVNFYDIKSSLIPKDFLGMRFIVLADLHNNSFGVGNEKLLKEIDKSHPDFIIVAGDMMVSSKPDEYGVAYSLLSKLAKKYPIYYGIGNHEQRVMPGGIYFNENYVTYQNKLQELGVRFLVNQTLIIKRKDSKLCITGLMIDKEFFMKIKQPEMSKEYIQKLVGIRDKGCYNILIAHNPMYFDTYKDWGADLTLSGHLHGGIVRLPLLGGIISPQYQILPKYDAGRFDEDGKTLLVSKGLGMHTIKLRMFNKPELMVVTLTSK